MSQQGNGTEAAGPGDATLRSVEVDPGKLLPEFWGERRSFVVTLPSSTDTISLAATASQAGAQVKINGEPAAAELPGPPYPLHVGRNVFSIEVTAPDGTASRSYELKAIRAAPLPNWVQVSEAAPWTPRDSAGDATFDNRMWIFGGYVPELISDVWCSADGEEWRQTGTIPAEAGINIPVNFTYDNRMWVSSNDGKLFASPDGAQWTLVSDALPCLPRYGAGCAVFNGRMWILGGAGGGNVYNDVWSSTDGVEWVQEVAVAPWSRRQLFGNVVVHDNKLWVIGGGLTNYQPFKAYRDVWCSTDGREWTEVTEEAPWPSRIWSCCAVYQGRMWLLGGFRAQPEWNNFNDVWYSSDGASWHRLETEALWSPRHELCAYVHQDRLWVVGGNAWPLLNDVWQLHLAGLTFTSQPVLEEIVHCRYTYHARADFHEGGGPLQYRLIESPPWLAIDVTSGTITGAPPETGDFPVIVEAASDGGETARQSYALSVITA